MPPARRLPSNQALNITLCFFTVVFGIGKTHLIQAVGNAVLAKNPKARVVYISSEQFVQEFVDALRYKKNTDLPISYRGADVLIVDDVQFLPARKKSRKSFSILLTPYTKPISK